MAGYYKIFVVGGLGGYQGHDGVNPIDLEILVGASDRQWFECRSTNAAHHTLGGIKVLIPKEPDELDAVLDACLLFLPRAFEGPSQTYVESVIRGAERLDFNLDGYPDGWDLYRSESMVAFQKLNIWEATLEVYNNGRFDL